MGILPYIMFVVAHGVLLLIDVATLFVLIRLVCYWRPIRLLAGFDALGRPLVDSLSQRADRCLRQFNSPMVCLEQHRLGIVLLILGTVRFVIALLVRIVL